MPSQELTPAAVSGWKRFMPIAAWAPTYSGGQFRGDLVAGLTVWALLVPEAMAYASLAGMPPETGLYTALLAPLLYAVFGSSRQLNVGPSSTVAVMSAAVVVPLAGDDPARFISLTVALALMVGVLFIAAGLLRLGFIADFMSKPVLDGFIIGLALTIAAGQAHKLFGVEATGESFFSDIGVLIRDLDQTVPATLAVGAISVALLFALEEWAPRIPAALVVTVLSIVSVSVLDLASRGVAIIGEIPSSLPVPAVPTDLSFGDLRALLPGALGIVVVGFAESIAAARSYAAKHRYKVDADQELIALGAANAGAGLFGGFVVDGSLSKSAAADQAGQKTQMASIVLTAAVFVTILFLTGLFENLAEATLGAIVIHAVWRLIKFGKVGRYRPVRRGDFAAGLAALIGVLAFDILTGLGIAVIVSMLVLLARASRPRWVVLGRTRATGTHDDDEVVFRDIATHPDAQTSPGLLILRFDAALFFANAPVFQQAVLDSIAAADTPVRVVLIDAEGITDIDSTALAMLDELTGELAELGIELWTARMSVPVAATTTRYRHIADVHPDRVYSTVRSAVDAFTAHPPSAPPGPDPTPEGTSS